MSRILIPVSHFPYCRHQTKRMHEGAGGEHVTRSLRMIQDWILYLSRSRTKSTAIAWAFPISLERFTQHANVGTRVTVSPATVASVVDRQWNRRTKLCSRDLRDHRHHRRRQLFRLWETILPLYSTKHLYWARFFGTEPMVTPVDLPVPLERYSLHTLLRSGFCTPSRKKRARSTGRATDMRVSKNEPTILE